MRARLAGLVREWQVQASNTPENLVWAHGYRKGLRQCAADLVTALEEGPMDTDQQKKENELETLILESGDRLLPFFRYAHLPAPLGDKSKYFAVLAMQIVREFPVNAERTVCLRKLLEAKDAGVRSLLP